MAMRPALTESESGLPDDWMPQPTFTPCATCGALVLWATDAEGVRRAVTPALGLAHECPTRIAWNAGEEIPAIE